MNKTAIEWCDYTVNPVKGLCPVACPYCYARKMYKRFGWREDIRFSDAAIDELLAAPAGSRVFVGSTMELFGNWVADNWMEQILHDVRSSPQATYVFLTKIPERLSRWNPWPGNAWVGATATNENTWRGALEELPSVNAPVKFISFEPLHGPIEATSSLLEHSGIDWVIIGAQTGPGAVAPDPRWVGDIILAAGSAGIPIFLKDNLGFSGQRREWPKNGNKQD